MARSASSWSSCASSSMRTSPSASSRWFWRSSDAREPRSGGRNGCDGEAGCRRWLYRLGSEMGAASAQRKGWSSTAVSGPPAGAGCHGRGRGHACQPGRAICDREPRRAWRGRYAMRGLRCGRTVQRRVRDVPVAVYVPARCRNRALAKKERPVMPGRAAGSEDEGETNAHPWSSEGQGLSN